MTDFTNKAELAEQLRAAVRQQFGVELPEDLNEFDRVLPDLWDKLPASQKELAELEARAKRARENDTPDGFADFFWCCSRLELPRHALYGWVVPVYFSHNRMTLDEFKAYFERVDAVKYQFIRDMVVEQVNSGLDMQTLIGIVIEASRELSKTTVITNYFTAFRIGHEPYRANLLIQVGDDIAKDNSSQVARVIRDFLGWKKCFPHVIPDTDKGWGEKGYEVKQTHTWENGVMVPLPSEKWNQMNATRKDPTLLGVGYSSHALQGKHPDGVCVVDDIEDEVNTSSEKELDSVLNIVESVINYAFTSIAWVTYVGTPWVEGDVLDYIKDTKAYISIVMPCYVEVVEGKVRLPEEWLEETEKVFMWEEQRGLEWVKKKLAQNRNMSEFLRMVLLNLKAAGERIYKYHSYPHKEIKWDEWEIVAGVDPTATFSSVSGKGAGVSHFAICYALKTPWNTIVIGDGYLEKVGADIGERELVKFVRAHPNFSRASIEDNGSGAIFIGMTKRNQGLTINPHSANELGVGIKKQRQFKFLSSYLAAGTVLISDEDTPFLNAIRKYLQRYPQVGETSEGLDAADALCYAVLDMPEVWTNAVVNVVRADQFGKKPARPRVDVGNYHYRGRLL